MSKASVIRARVEPDLADRVDKAAEAEGVTQSELMRRWATEGVARAEIVRRVGSMPGNEALSNPLSRWAFFGNDEELSNAWAALSFARCDHEPCSPKIYAAADRLALAVVARANALLNGTRDDRDDAHLMMLQLLFLVTEATRKGNTLCIELQREIEESGWLDETAIAYVAARLDRKLGSEVEAV